MLPLLLLPLLWAGSLQEDAGYKLQLQESVAVQAGLCALVPCSFSYPWSGWSPPSKLYIYWIREGDRTYYDGPVATNNPDMGVRTEHRNRFHLPGDVRDNNCSLLIRDAKKKDTGSYVLMADVGWNTRYTFRDKKLTLQVTALTEKPVIHSLEPLESGRPTSLSCRLPGSCEGGRPLQFSWTGAVTSSMAPGALQSSVLSLTPRPQDHDTNLTCQVKLQGSAVTTESTVQLNVSYAPQNLSVRILFGNSTALKVPSGPTSLPVLEGESLHLVCMADSNPPASLSWSWKTRALSPSQVSASGVLKLPFPGAEDEAEFTCQVQNPLGSQQLFLSLSVQSVQVHRGAEPRGLAEPPTQDRVSPAEGVNLAPCPKTKNLPSQHLSLRPPNFLVSRDRNTRGVLNPALLFQLKTTSF
ncbi:sialic acid-binding Ig-like lectin 14 isoform X2 [Marmota flaviventris]|uniref:sialic acid-binding Ig-like lectin 14 isoform X2 n=1 Tax=Marmota flaviventris TaxID=93162 RepID=UPI003A8659A8